MGLQGSVNDCSSESIFILLIAIIANAVSYLRSVVSTILRKVGLSRVDPEEGLLGAVGSGLGGLIVVAEQLNLNRVFSYRYGCQDEAGGWKCLVCLSKVREGEQVRRLACCHVFHKDCLNFSCPLCRWFRSGACATISSVFPPCDKEGRP